jgi:Antitoxin of toxin-antitoxin, RelE / RelB, TA system
MAIADGMPTLCYPTLQEGRSHLSEVLDAAQDGLMVSMQRGRSRRDAREGPVSVVKTSVLQGILEQIVAERVEAHYNEADRLYTVAINGLPLAAEGEQLSDAVDELVEDIRFYHDDWVSSLRHAPNHEGNVPLIWLTQSMQDEELRDWLMLRVGG